MTIYDAICANHEQQMRVSGPKADHLFIVMKPETREALCRELAPWATKKTMGVCAIQIGTPLGRVREVQEDDPTIRLPSNVLALKEAQFYTFPAKYSVRAN